MSERTVGLDGARLAVEVVGHGRPLVWGHGLTSSRALERRRRVFQWQLRDTMVVRYDARAHGGSTGTPEPDRYRWAHLALDMLAVADSVGAERFTAGGASMGAATALHLAAQAPERVSGLVLAIPPTAWHSRAGQADLYQGAAHVVEKYGLDDYLGRIAALPPPPVLEPEAEAFRTDPQVPEDLLPAVFRGAAASDLPEPDTIAGLDVPALVLAWDTDPGHPVSTAERLHELLGESALHVATTLTQVREEWPVLVRRFVDSLR